jgi:Holliday junction resolvase RusA-like endonuclease
VTLPLDLHTSGALQSPGETGAVGNEDTTAASGGDTTSLLVTPTVPVLSFIARGIPKPKGSLRHVGNGRLKEQIDNAPWRDTIIWTVASAMSSPDPILGPVRVEATFTFPKPTSAPKTRMSWPTTRTSGDIDKDCRLLLDALQSAGAIKDDAQVTELCAAKRFVNEGDGALAFPGVAVRIYRIQPTGEPA